MGMDIDTAMRLAAIATEGVSQADARKIIKEFCDRLLECTACGGKGGLVIQQSVQVTAGGSGFTSSQLHRGSRMECPQCAGSTIDYEWGEWNCDNNRDFRGRTANCDEHVHKCGPALKVPKSALAEQD